MPNRVMGDESLGQTPRLSPIAVSILLIQCSKSVGMINLPFGHLQLFFASKIFAKNIEYSVRFLFPGYSSTCSVSTRYSIITLATPSW
jgi:hypothetical protein